MQTVAFTATLTQIASDPYLFALTLAPIEKYRSSRQERNQQQSGHLEAGEKGQVAQPPKAPKTLGRDRRLLGIFALCVGAGVAECLLYSRAGVRGGMTVAAGFKLIQAVSSAVIL